MARSVIAPLHPADSLTIAGAIARLVIVPKETSLPGTESRVLFQELRGEFVQPAIRVVQAAEGK